jgi:hypothetical protein
MKISKESKRGERREKGRYRNVGRKISSNSIYGFTLYLQFFDSLMEGEIILFIIIASSI